MLQFLDINYELTALQKLKIFTNEYTYIYIFFF